MSRNRSWMYRRLLDDKNFNPDFFIGVDRFVEEAFKHPSCVMSRDNKDMIRCPCRVCDNTKFLTGDEVRKHLFHKRFTLFYKYWQYHGEEKEYMDKMNEIAPVVAYYSRKLPGGRYVKFSIMGNIISDFTNSVSTHSTTSSVASSVASSVVMGPNYFYDYNNDDDEDDEDYIPGMESESEPSFEGQNKFDESYYDEPSFDFDAPSSDDEVSSLMM